MEAWMAFGSIVAIVAIVLIAGGLIAVIGHMVIGSFDTDKKPKIGHMVIGSFDTDKKPKQVKDSEYTQVKQIENAKENNVVVENDYDFEKLDESKAQLEKEKLESEAEDDDMLLLEDSD